MLLRSKSHFVVLINHFNMQCMYTASPFFMYPIQASLFNFMLCYVLLMEQPTDWCPWEEHFICQLRKTNNTALMWLSSKRFSSKRKIWIRWQKATGNFGYFYHKHEASLTSPSLKSKWQFDLIYYFTLQKYFVNYKQYNWTVTLFSNVPNSLLPATYQVSLNITLLYKLVAAGIAWSL
jgi:hypothetical protein